TSPAPVPDLVASAVSSAFIADVIEAMRSDPRYPDLIRGYVQQAVATATGRSAVPAVPAAQNAPA
ncbi:MAG: hypothetical protein ACRD1G_14705, partial [Acidimicrobiales bacterium]